ncbi:MAG: hypothetical protein OEL89_01225 [Candidatus Peregrinibacteria bacterium]|nr:hypothetical protein [Candidatus Peregrinibacteria bacterium]
MEYKKAQVGVEFMIIMGALLLFVSIFLLIIQGNTEDKRYQREDILTKEVALTVQNEINLALKSGDGYIREFKIPEKIGELEYEISVDSGVVYIRTDDGRHALTLPVIEINGSINVTNNVIEKINGVVYLNR